CVSAARPRHDRHRAGGTGTTPGEFVTGAVGRSGGASGSGARPARNSAVYNLYNEAAASRRDPALGWVDARGEIRRAGVAARPIGRRRCVGAADGWGGAM